MCLVGRFLIWVLTRLGYLLHTGYFRALYSGLLVHLCASPKTSRSLAEMGFVGQEPLTMSCALCPHGSFVLCVLCCAASYGKDSAYFPHRIPQFDALWQPSRSSEI